ncbi:MAG: nitrous oxide reductase family maturation protein NosD [Longimicrobiales bacterium]|nr:nitrous oxide reductase family maturation protein NosD [Longimicrobiales bacterium]
MRAALLLVTTLTFGSPPVGPIPASSVAHRAPDAAPRVLHVGPAGDFATIGEAVSTARGGDTVRVAPGVYREPTVLIDRPLTLLGSEGTVLDGEGQRGLIEIRADSVTVAGLTLRDTGISFTSDRAAILVDQARFCTLRENRLEDTFFGIYLANAGECLLQGNTLVAEAVRETRSGNGIHLWYSTRIEIIDNRVEGHRDGIYFEFVEDSRVADNRSVGNVRYGLHFMFSDRCSYRRNTFADNGAGVAVMYTEEIVMEGNDFRGNRGSAAFGLLLKDITDSEIFGNRFLRNSVAVHAEGVNRVELRENDFLDNGWAIKIMANSEDSRVSSNNFIGNSFDVATNSRRSYSEFDGNYWDRYRGYDRDADGVGDVPFHPVRLFSLVVAQNEPALILQRSPLVALLDIAEQVLPVLTPANLTDRHPRLSPLPSPWRAE